MHLLYKTFHPSSWLFLSFMMKDSDWKCCCLPWWKILIESKYFIKHISYALGIGCILWSNILIESIFFVKNIVKIFNCWNTPFVGWPPILDCNFFSILSFLLVCCYVQMKIRKITTCNKLQLCIPPHTHIGNRWVVFVQEKTHPRTMQFPWIYCCCIQRTQYALFCLCLYNCCW